MVWRCSTYCRRYVSTDPLETDVASQKADNTQEIEALFRAVEKVETPKYRRFLELTLLGTKTQQIAQELGIKVDAVKNVRNRAIVAVRKLIEIE